MLKIILSLFVALSLSSILQANEVQQDTLDELMLLSGIDSQAHDTLQSIKSIITSRNAEKANQHIQIIEKLIDPDVLVDDIEGSLKGSLTEKEAKELIAWYGSNLGNRIVQAEAAAAQPEAMISIQKSAASLMADNERQALSHELVAASGFFDKSIDTQTLMTLVGEVVALKNQDAEVQVDVEVIKKLIESQQSAMQAQLESFLVLMISYTYRNFSAGDIREYIRVMKSPAMSKFNKLGQEASLQSLEKMIKVFAGQ